MTGFASKKFTLFQYYRKIIKPKIRLKIKN